MPHQPGYISIIFQHEDFMADSHTTALDLKN